MLPNAKLLRNMYSNLMIQEFLCSLVTVFTLNKVHYVYERKFIDFHLFSFSIVDGNFA